jgi:hypothetical protein
MSRKYVVRARRLFFKKMKNLSNTIFIKKAKISTNKVTMIKHKKTTSLATKHVVFMIIKETMRKQVTFGYIIKLQKMKIIKNIYKKIRNILRTFLNIKITKKNIFNNNK